MCAYLEQPEISPLAWYRDDSDENLYERHFTDPPRILTPQEVFEKSGVRLIKVQHCNSPIVQAKLREEGNYKTFDWLELSRETLPNYDERMKKLYDEHLHKDQEIRLITEGSGYFEIRDYENKWIRLHLKKSDLIQLPAGMYHRLTLDEQNYMKMLRLFSDSPQWEAVDRPNGDAEPSRFEYLQSIPSTTIE